MVYSIIGENGLETVDESTSANVGCTEVSAKEERSVNGTSSNGLADPENSECLKLLQKKVASFLSSSSQFSHLTEYCFNSINGFEISMSEVLFIPL